MQVNLSLDEMRRIIDWYETMPEPNSIDNRLAERVQEWIEELEELEDIDLNDCAGGACKL